MNSLAHRWMAHHNNESQVTQLLNQLTIEYGPKSAQLIDAVLLPFIRRTFELIPGAGAGTAIAASPNTANGAHQGSGDGSGPGLFINGSAKMMGAAREGEPQQQLLPHEIAERSGIQKLYFSVIQHIASNGLAGVLSSPTNGAHLDGVLRSVLGGLSGREDAPTKKTCLYIFSLLLGDFNREARARDHEANGGTGSAPAVNGTAAASATPTVATPIGGGGRVTKVTRLTTAGMGGGLWTGPGARVGMDAGVRSAVTTFTLEEAVPAALKCLVDEPPAGLDLRDATAMTAILHMGALLKEAKESSGGSGGFVGAAAVACNCTPQVSQLLFGKSAREDATKDSSSKFVFRIILVRFKADLGYRGFHAQGFALECEIHYLLEHNYSRVQASHISLSRACMPRYSCMVMSRSPNSCSEQWRVPQVDQRSRRPSR